VSFLARSAVALTLNHVRVNWFLVAGVGDQRPPKHLSMPSVLFHVHRIEAFEDLKARLQYLDFDDAHIGR
jgi:hypothetical protein